MLQFNKAAVMLVSLSALTLNGCLDGGSDNKSVGNVDTAKTAAAASLAKAINTTIHSVETVTENSTAVKVVAAKGLVNVPLNAKMQADVINRFKKLATSPALRAVTTGRTLNSEPALFTTLPKPVTEEELLQYLGTPTQSGNTLTYPLNADKICEEDNDLSMDDEAACRDLLSHITVVQTVEDADTGTLTLKVDTAAPLVIGYDTNSVYLQIDLAEAKASVIALDPNSAAELPETVVGAVRVTVTVLNASVGAESAALKVGITTAINISGTASGENVTLQLAAADKLFEIAADAGANTASLSFGVGLVHFEFPSDTTPTTPSELHLGGLTGVFALSNDILTGTNIGITEEFYFDEDTSDMAKDAVVTLPAFDMTVNGSTSIVKFTKALDFKLSEDLIGTTEDGTLSILASANTEILVIEDNVTVESTSKVTVGSVNITGTGIYGDGGPINATPSSNACFSATDVTKFPLVVVSCP